MPDEPQPNEHVSRFVVEVRSRPGHALVDDTTRLRRALIQAAQEADVDAAITAPFITVAPRLNLRALLGHNKRVTVTVPVLARLTYDKGRRRDVDEA